VPAPVEAARPPTSVVVKAAAVTVTPELVLVDDDGADSVAPGPSRVADLGAGSVRSAGATRPRRGPATTGREGRRRR